MPLSLSSLGGVEIVVLGLVVGAAGLAHLVAALSMVSSKRKCPRWLFAVYGIPVCFAIASIITPPDVLSSLAVGVPLALLYAAVVCAWGLWNRRKVV